MKWWIFFLLMALALVAAALVSPALLQDPGRVVVGVGPWEIETSFVGVVLLVAVVWVLLSVLWWLFRWPQRWARSQRHKRSRRQLEAGFLALVEGEWADAQKAFQQSLTHEKSVAGLLGAARAAQEQSDFKARDEWLQQIKSKFGRKHFVTELARAKFSLEEGQYDQAIEILERLHLKKTKHLGVLRALLEAYQETGRWRELRELAPALKRAGMVDGQKAGALIQLAARKELTRCDDYEQLQWAWKALSREQRRDNSTLLAYSSRAHELGHDARASHLLSKRLDTELNPLVLQAYRLCGDVARADRIVDLEKRLSRYPNHPYLLQTLGFLYLDARQDEKAERCLEEAAKQLASSELYTALGQIKDRSGDAIEAASYYRRALQQQPGAEQRLIESSAGNQ